MKQSIYIKQGYFGEEYTIKPDSIVDVKFVVNINNGSIEKDIDDIPGLEKVKVRYYPSDPSMIIMSIDHGTKMTVYDISESELICGQGILKGINLNTTNNLMIDHIELTDDSELMLYLVTNNRS